MINKKIITLGFSLLLSSSLSFSQTNLSNADVNICQSYLEALKNSSTTLTDKQKQQVNKVLNRCLSNNPSACMAIKSSNCKNMQSRIELFGEAIPTEKDDATAATNNNQSKEKAQATAQPNPLKQPRYTPPVEHNIKQPTQPNTEEPKDTTSSFSYF